uniref:Large-conductance mechanosensitive channel n=1 Tax=Mimivirus LCMiAC01 TaxID=2506608 RepID=A0A481YZE2_9VIRU|nr:MAG: hypothetical protein LCMiAC01_03000 [Mimivirus LCMiAC01]
MNSSTITTNNPNNVVNFIKILNKYNILSIIIAGILSDKLNELTTTFVNTLILPFINRNKNGKNNKNNKNNKKMEDISIHFYGMNFKIGHFLLIFIKFVIIIFVTFLLSKLLKYS